MSQPLVSVVIETITARFGSTSSALADDLQRSLGGLALQTYPAERIETIVVLDSAVPADVVAEVRRRYPQIRLVFSGASNYLAAKNAGASASAGEFIALLDGDCEPEPDWLEALLSPFEKGADAVAGRARYEGRSFASRTFSIPDFAYVIGEENGDATGFNINNVAFRRDVLLTHPFDTRIRRDGGCYFLYHHLRADGFRVIYEPRAITAHRLDIGHRFGFVRKHFNRGHAGVSVYRLDDRGVLKGTRLFRRTGALGLIAIYLRRIVADWMRMLRHRRQIGIAAITLPYYAAVDVITRLIQLAGALTAVIAPGTARQV